SLLSIFPTCKPELSHSSCNFRGYFSSNFSNKSFISIFHKPPLSLLISLLFFLYLLYLWNIFLYLLKFFYFFCILLKVFFLIKNFSYLYFLYQNISLKDHNFPVFQI